MLVPVGEPGPDVVFECLDGAVDSSLELLLGEFGEPPFHQVQPRRTRRCEVQVEPRVRQQPLLHVRRLVRRIVVEDEMDLEIRRHLLADLGQELLELGGPVPSVEEPMTLPVATSRAEKSVVVPARM
ncbi:hypothetical protein Slala03_21480 [Streptomyces lavendulae subsp. lavendulae]|nr:hypothetical protein Slala03_21480 [Streptomyces lavendulae subsp. lavendulae]